MDMSLSAEDFRRLLPGALGQAPRWRPDGAEGPLGSGRWRITLAPLADHRLGSVALPMHRVVICLEGVAEAEAEAFLARFHRGFQRGGG